MLQFFAVPTMMKTSTDILLQVIAYALCLSLLEVQYRK